VGVAADGDGGAYVDEVGFREEDLLGLDGGRGTFSQMALTSFSGMISRR
jgi:hypothetical protein